MGNKLQTTIQEEDIQFLEEVTIFKKSEILDFYKYFMKINQEGYMNFEEFKGFLFTFYERQFLDRIENLAGHYFRAADKDKTGKINFREFLLFVNHECTTSPKARLEWIFDLFDIDGNRTIDRKEMINISQTSLDLNEAHKRNDPTANEIADKMFECCDKNHDDLITKEEFVSTFMGDQILFSVFCLKTTPE